MTTETMPRLVQKILARAAQPNESSFSLEATNLFNFHTAMQLAAGFRGERPVVWTNVFFPYELCYALDLIPLSFEVMGGLAASLGLLEVLQAADDAYPARDACTFLRAGLGGGIERLFPPPAALTATSHLCEGAPKVAHALGREYGVPYFLLDVPDRHTRDAERYVAHQLEEITRNLEDLSGRTLCRERLVQVLEESNRAAAALTALDTLRRRRPAPIFGSPSLGLRLYLPWGHPAGTEIAEQLLREAQARVDEGVGALPGGENFRLLWLHLRPYYDTDLFEFLEVERRAVIVYSSFGQAYWDPLDPADPMRSLARRILQNPDLQPAAAAAEYYVREGRAHQVDGVIQFSHWGCRWNAGRNRMLKDAFAAEGTPFLNVDGDGVDPRAATTGQLRTRVEAFLEMLEARDD